jgi:ribonuclease J
MLLTMHAKLRAIPLGGLGHVGGNLMAYETATDLIAVDCGVLFPSAEQPGVDYVIPDVSYLLARRDKLRAFLLTHGHEDHIGALPWVLDELDVPVYGTRLTLALLRNKLAEHPHLNPTLEEMRDGRRFTVGDFDIEPIPVTHSIPDAVALALRTPAGTVIHSGDFKIDDAPLDGRRTAIDRLARLGDEGVAILFSDSTNAEHTGSTWGEREIGETLDPLIATAPHRVFVTAFASNLHRLQLVISASERAGRRVVPLGRSMQQNIQLSLERGFIRARSGVVGEARSLHRIPRDRVTVLASGSQGEPHSAMTRIARGLHGQAQIEPGDRVILSSRRIPGNARAVGAMVNDLFRLGAEVIDDRVARVHTSGHAFNDEQRRFIELCRPHFFVPIHGEYRHLVHHGRLAESCGLSRDRIAIIEDGQPIEIERRDGSLSWSRCEPEESGYVYVDGKGVGDVGEGVLRERRILSETGLVTCVVILGEGGEIVRGPEIVTRGVFRDGASSGLVERAAAEVGAALARRDTNGPDVQVVSERIHQVLRRFFRRELDRRPILLPVVLTV